MAKDKRLDRKPQDKAAEASNGAAVAAASAAPDGNAEDTTGGAPGTGDVQQAGDSKPGDEVKSGSDAATAALGIVLATVLSTEAKPAVIKAAAEIKPGGEYGGSGGRDYVISGISGHFKVEKAAVVAELDKALAANVEKAKGDETVAMTVPRRFMLRTNDGKEKLFTPGTVRVPRHIAEHPYVKAHGCKIV